MKTSLKLLTVLLITVTLSFAQRPQPNQAVVEASKQYPATVFNRALVITVQVIDGDRVTATLHSKDASDVTLEQKTAGYETTCGNFTVRVREVKGEVVTFFVQRD